MVNAWGVCYCIQIEGMDFKDIFRSWETGKGYKSGLHPTSAFDQNLEIMASY